MIRIILLAAGLASTSVASAQDVPVNSIGLQKARSDALKTKGWQPAYTTKFDLSGLPEYRPTAISAKSPASGARTTSLTVRSKAILRVRSANPNPDVRFENNLSSTFIGMGDVTKKARPLPRWPSARTSDDYRHISGVRHAARRDLIATGTMTSPDGPLALVPFVDEENPLHGSPLRRSMDSATSGTAAGRAMMGSSASRAGRRRYPAPGANRG